MSREAAPKMTGQSSRYPNGINPPSDTWDPLDGYGRTQDGESISIAEFNRRKKQKEKEDNPTTASAFTELNGHKVDLRQAMGNTAVKGETVPNKEPRVSA